QIFEVSSWIVNVLKAEACSGNGLDPDITFTVTDLSNKILATYTTGSITKKPQSVWSPYYFTFKTPAGVNEVVLRIISKANAGCGNEFGIDDIEFRPCLPVMKAGVSGFSTAQIEICETDLRSFLLSATYEESPDNFAIQWQESKDFGFTWTDIPGSNQNKYSVTPNAIGEHFYRFTLKQAANINYPSCTFASNTIKIKIAKKPFARATNYVYGCYGTTVIMGAAGGIDYSWTGPNGFSSDLQYPEIPNVTYANTGLYVVNVKDHNGCTSADSTTLTIYDAPVGNVSFSDTSLCEESAITLTAKGGQNYEWIPATGLSNAKIANPIATIQESILYTVRVYNEYTCYDTLSVKINAWKKPKAFAGPDKFVLKNRAVQLEGKVEGNNINYSWSPPDYLDNPMLINPKASPPASQIYTLTVVSDQGCGTSTDEMKLEVIDKLYVPNAFTPNGDGLNDKWTIILFEEYPNGTVQVFSRFGQLVYRGYANNYIPWDGRFKGEPTLAGTYVYFIDLGNGSSLLKGSVTVIY
ncbi:MAG TPA: gliding motility-associated C-terminal domain-containing protein, partial [Chitinophagaceae bacterium]|nr:gliding motility-associated C-terminal domain-containing protein [Chitinophagaceae bacterium]